MNYQDIDLDKRTAKTLAILQDAMSDYNKEAVVAELLQDDLISAFFRILNDTQFKSKADALEELRRMTGAILDIMETDLPDLECPPNN